MKKLSCFAGKIAELKEERKVVVEEVRLLMVLPEMLCKVEITTRKADTGVELGLGWLGASPKKCEAKEWRSRWIRTWTDSNATNGSKKKKKIKKGEREREQTTDSFCDEKLIALLGWE